MNNFIMKYNNEVSCFSGFFRLTLKRMIKTLWGYALMFCLVYPGTTVRADTELLHTYGNSLGQEIIIVLAVSQSELLPLLPAGYDLISADSVGFGSADQGIVVIANFRGIDPTVDHRKPLTQNQVAIDVAILVSEPSGASEAGVDIADAFHVYALGIFTNDARYAASLRRTNLPVEFVNKIGYQRDMNDTTGEGNLVVNIPSKDSPFQTFSISEGYSLVPGEAFNAVFWYEDEKHKTVLHFQDEPFRQGLALSQIYTKPDSFFDSLFNGGGIGPCDPHPASNYNCVSAPALNMRYDEGTVGSLQQINK